MSVFSNLLDGFASALTPMNLLWVIIGAILGTMIGILPGLGNPAATLAVLLPLTLQLPATTGLITMAGIYHGAKFAGATTAILLNIPTETSSVVLCYDGHELAKQGRAGPAMGMSAISGFIASTVGVIALTFAAPAAAAVAVKFGPPEFAMLMLFGLLLVVTMAGKSPVKGLISMVAGLLVATVGVDLFTGTQRYTFGSIDLYDGIEFLTLTLGLFAVGEVLVNLQRKRGATISFVAPKRLRDYLPNREDFRRSRVAIALGSVIGFFVGAVPGGGSTIGSFVSYALVKNTSRRKHLFGKGAIEGVAGPEAANNSESGGAMIPLLSLGLPGSASTSVMLAALVLYGVQPGPLLFTDHPEIGWPVIASLYLGTIALLVLNLPLIPMWVQILRIPYWLLYPVILVLAIVGAYSVRGSMFDIWLLLGFSALGYVFRKLDIPSAPMLMAFVLGPQAELTLRQSLTLSDDSPLIFVQRPVSAAILGVTVAVVLFAVVSRQRKRRAALALAAPGAELVTVSEGER
ncbi:tripartite tricarboxylate transporter permease [Amycolatopsis sp. DSM 110486]|uniref:tripartite tricarboxylate transporter permease n=1 Tax=Amycolatopsis sp. DSM 110486 TaxID=2865832 RepID=UPI001C6A3E06|nr:tripartite tricarboxylate transporter permease [Amycolatopsis sp. DSM 110486]QYN20539.1 tripartite tricarboxylate transporter permease [Amycolatopsis sp. DSM 110486]